MRYIWLTFSNGRDAHGELVVRPIYRHTTKNQDHAMFTRRAAIAATVLLALFGAACGNDGGAHVAAAGEPTSTSSSSTPTTAAVVTTTTAIETTTTTTAPPATTAPQAASVHPTPAPEPARIEVDYQPASGSTAAATIEGPNGSHTKSLASGAAIFSGLPSGTYSVTVTIDTPSDDPALGSAQQVLNGGTMQVEAGDHGVVSCDDANGCTAVL